MTFAFGPKCLGCLLRDMNPTLFPITLHTRCCIYCIAKELEARFFASQHAGSRLPAVETNSVIDAIVNVQ